jgi:predicted protein tyrosine phosphatase
LGRNDKRADLIFVIEKKHERRLREKYSSELNSKRIIRLDIPDEYTFMDEEVIEVLKNRVSEYSKSLILFLNIS